VVSAVDWRRALHLKNEKRKQNDCLLVRGQMEKPERDSSKNSNNNINFTNRFVVSDNWIGSRSKVCLSATERECQRRPVDLCRTRGEMFFINVNESKDKFKPRYM
jgi:hypothetical protein